MDPAYIVVACTLFFTFSLQFVIPSDISIAKIPIVISRLLSFAPLIIINQHNLLSNLDIDRRTFQFIRGTYAYISNPLAPQTMA